MIANLNDLKDRLVHQIKNSNKVFIVGHNSPDFDAIGSSIGLATLAKSLGKECHIIVDDDLFKIESGAKKIIDECRDNYSIINRGEFLDKVDDNSLLIITDTNNRSLLSIKDDLNSFSSIFVIDHHCEVEDTVLTNNSFISIDSSSSSEIVTRLLNDLNVTYSPEVASYLLAGISLDTKRFKQSTTSITHDVAEKLIEHGANIDYVNHLFLEEFDSFCRISNLIINGTNFKKYKKELIIPVQVSFTLDRKNPTFIYQKEDFAKAADRMMKFNGIDASFALGFIDPNIVHVSARSGKRVNVGNIMSQMNGGGNMQSAGGQYQTNDIFKIENELIKNIHYGISDDDSIIRKR